MDVTFIRRLKKEWTSYLLFIFISCFLEAVPANSHRHQEHRHSSVQVPLMIQGTFATSKVMRSFNEATVYIAAFEQYFVLDVQKSRNYSVLQSTVETIYRSQNKPFRRKATLSDGCFFHGNIRDKKKSLVFLDACSKSISGTVYNGNYTYIISGAAKENPKLHEVTRLISVERLRHERRQDPAEMLWRRWRRETRQVTQPSQNLVENKHLELYIVHDHQQFLDNNRNADSLKNKSIALAHLLGKVFENVNISISLVGSEVWNEGDEVTMSSDVYTTLDNFLAWREDELFPRQPHDFALLVSGTTFMHHMKAHTYHGEMCSQSHSAVIIEDYTDDLVQIASDAAHSIGHNIGLMHDTKDCSCDDDTGYCVMDVVKRKQPPTKFSSCSKGAIANFFRVGRLDCLNNLPAIPRGPLCGNGLLEEGEECDCGKPQECNDLCCQPSECLRRPDCSRRSSQILAAAEVVTAPLDAPETEEEETLPLTSGLNIQEDRGVETLKAHVDEAVEERFNTINTDGVVGIPQPGTPEPTSTDVRMASLQEVEGVVVAHVEDLINAETIMRREQLSADVGPAGDTSNSSTGVACDVQSSVGETQEVFGNRASVAEILEELGQSELPELPAFIIQPQPKVYIVRSKNLHLHCEASGTSVLDYTWWKDGEEIDIQSDPRMILQHGNLTIQFPDSGDVGIYQCLVSTIYTTIVSSKTSVIRASMGRFAQGPGTIREAIVGTSVILACNPPLSVPTPLVMWAVNSSADPIRYSRRVSQDPRGNLVIASVEEHDTGLYHCIVVNEIMEMRIESPRINLIVREPAQPPEITYQPDANVIGLEGEQLSLKCLAVGSPVPQIWWEREEGELPYNRSSHTSFGQELIITSLRLKDAGQYRCIADNGEGDRDKATVTLTVKAAPSWESEPVSLTIPVGAPASFTCSARGDPTPAVSWLINNQPAHEISESLKLDLVEEPGYGSVRVNRTLDVDSSSAVQCVASNVYGSIISNAYLTVLALAPVFSEAAPAELIVLEGNSIHLPCQGFGAPSPTVTWWKGSGEKFVSEGDLQILVDGSLSLCGVSLSHETEYKCVIENQFGYQTSKTQLFIRSKTHIIHPPMSTTVTVGDPLILDCHVTYDPTHDISFTWMTPRGLEVRLGSGGEGSLRIDQVSEEDEGIYTCTAKSALDSVSATATVEVRERPIPALCGNGILDDGEDCDGGVYNASNVHPCCSKYCEWRDDVPCRGDTQCCKDCQLLEMGAPCQLVVEYLECFEPAYCNGLDSQCDYQYLHNGSSCRNDGQCLKGECIPFCELQGGLESCDCQSDADTCVHCCVKDGICAPFIHEENNSTTPRSDKNGLVCGRNGVCHQGECTGQDPTPEPTKRTTPAPTSTLTTTGATTTVVATTQHGNQLPNAPSEVTMTSLSSPLDVQITWTVEHSEHITQFDVEAQTRYSHGSWTILASVPGNKTQVRVNLAPYVIYSFRVTSVNDRGRSEPREISGQYATPADRPISNPQNVSFAVENGQSVIHWKPMNLEEHGAPYFSYKVLWRPLGREAWQEASVEMSEYSFIIPGSEDDRQYEVSVQATNGFGDGPQPEVFIFGRASRLEIPVQVNVKLTEILTTIGSSVTLPCEVIHDHPLTGVHWTLNGEIVYINAFNQTLQDYSLVLESVEWSDLGEWQCVAETASNSSSDSVELISQTLGSTTSPNLGFALKPPEEVQVIVGSRLTLPCQAIGTPKPRTEWFFNNRRVVKSNQVEVDRNDQLVIDPADLSNTGTYLCRISNAVTGDVEMAISDVTVVAPMLVFTSTPPDEVDVLIGRSIELPCQAGGFPQATLVWKFANDAIDYGVDIYMAENNSIIIPVAAKSHSGLYQCIISNGLHNVKTANSQVNVREPLNVSIDPVGILTVLGSSVTLPCEVIHDHPLTGVHWTLNGEIVYINAFNQTLQDYSLVLESVELSDQGEWQCVAETALESRNDSIRLVIQTAPERPSNVRITPTEHETTGIVTFDTPFDGNSPILSYVIEYSSPAGEVPWTRVKTIAPSNSNQVFTRLTIPPYYGYYMRVMAENEFGLSEPSEVSEPIYMRAIPPTRNPAGVMAEVLDDGLKINVTWEPLNKSELNGPGFYYIIDLRGANQGFASMVTIDDYHQSNIILNVDPSLLPYEIMMQSGNDIGLGPVPEVVTAGVEEVGLAVPDAPTNVIVEMITPTSIRITWNPVPQRPSYGNVYGYRVVVQATEAVVGARPESCLSTTPNCEIAGLQRGTTYHVTVIANGEGGEGFSSMPVTITIPEDVPSAVRKLKVRTWARTMLIKWEKPEIGDIQGYIVSYQPTTIEGMSVEENISNPSATSLKLGGLTPGTGYDVTVLAFSQAGQGEPTSMNVITRSSKSKRSHQ